MYLLDESGDVFFDESRGCLGVKGDPGKTVQLQAQQSAVLKKLCEQAGRVVTYNSLYREAHDDIFADLGDERAVARTVQGKVHEIRKALSSIGVTNSSQLIVTNRTISGYEIHLPSNVEGTAPLEDREVDLQAAASEHAAFVHKCITESTSIARMAEAGVYYDELRRSAISKDSIVRCQRVGERGFLFKFRLSQLDYRPLFASLVLRFWDPLNLKNYLALDNEAAFTFAVNNFENALAAITVEFKYASNHAVFKAETRELTPGENQIRIQLAPMNYAPLSEITEICFVVHPDTMNAIDGEIVIDSIAVDFNANGSL